MNNRALIAMSGGVDSSVAAAIMIKNGFQCVGVTMKLFDGENDKTEKTCCSLSDAEDAKAVSYSLGMSHYTFNFKEEFSKKVIDKFVKEYENGFTPNPCIDCNKFLKFGKLYERAEILSCDAVVTGHYAVIEYNKEKDRYFLKKSLNKLKDQSYVLYFLTQEQLRRTRFPLGEFPDKESVRQVAREYGFINSEKRDSQDICFVPDNDYASFIEKYTGKTYKEGAFLDVRGNVLGVHKGIIRYTIGQRRGLGLQVPNSVYVLSKNLKDNTVTVTEEAGLYTSKMIVGGFNWIYPKPEREIKVNVMTRYRSKETPALARPFDDKNVEIIFDEPVRAVTPGQAAALYDGDYVVGGGTITETRQ